MGELTVADGKGKLSLDRSGILHLKWRPGSFVGAADARASILAVEELSEGKIGPILITMTDVDLGAGAKEIYQQTRAVAAVALVGSTQVDRVVAAGMKRKRHCPHAFFTSEVEALSWLLALSGQ